jgi:hypothetical protein
LENIFVHDDLKKQFPLGEFLGDHFVKTLSTDDLLYELKRQFPSGPTTMGGCRGRTARCKGMARGSGLCAPCCQVRLVERGVDEELLDEFVEQLTLRRDTDRNNVILHKAISDKIHEIQERISPLEP